MRERLFCLRLVLLSAIACVCALGQQNTGSIYGTVTAPNGAVIAGAKVQATHTETSQVFSAETNEAGLYVFPSVPMGQYAEDLEEERFRRLWGRPVGVRDAR